MLTLRVEDRAETFSAPRKWFCSLLSELIEICPSHVCVFYLSDPEMCGGEDR